MKNFVLIPRRIIAFIIIIASLLAIMIASCDPIARSSNTSSNCSVKPAADYHTYDFGSPDSKYVYVLVDQSYDYKFTSKALGLILSTVIPNMFPGDRLVVAWINLERGTQTIIFDKRVERERVPQFPPTLTPPSVTPTLTPSSHITTLQGQQIQTNEAIDRDNRVIKEEYYCKIGEWNALSDSIFRQWKDKQERRIDSFSSEANATLTPLITAKVTSNGKLLYEALSTASQMLQSARGKRQYQKYILIVFSDMKDWRLSKPDNLQIKLDGVEVLIISQSCKYEIDCHQVKTDWDSQLKSFGVINPLFLVQEDNIEKKLYDYLSVIP